MKKNAVYAIVILAVILVGAFALWPKSSGLDTTLNTGEAQKIVLGESGSKYQDVVVEAGKPIEISAGRSVTGCARSVVFNVGGKTYSKYLQTTNDVLTLPALEKGTYNFACSMGMVSGMIVVE